MTHSGPWLIVHVREFERAWVSHTRIYTIIHNFVWQAERLTLPLKKNQV